ncbi:MAG: Uma2 family endonuclease [Chloroflexaceae bacterium]|nr:Uma2 family endonuclease [Chloroflexaceae bacterium]
MTRPIPSLEESLPSTGSNGEPDGRDPFRYGWRYVRQVSNGIEEWERVPLTEDDVLHPQLEDYIVQSNIHQCLCHYLYTVLRSRMQDIPGGLVLQDVLIEWGVPGLKGHAPDLAVFAEVWEPPQEGSFDLRTRGGRPLLVIEVTSPTTRHLDVASPYLKAKTKFRHYAQARIPLYFVVDVARRVSGQAPPIFGYELTEDGYQPLPPNEEGWLWIAPVGLWIGTRGTEVVCFDEQGQRIWGYEEERAARLAEQQARQTAEERAQAAEERAQAAEERSQQEQQARQAEQQARQTAEEQARAAEARAQELERKLQQMRADHLRTGDE